MTTQTYQIRYTDDFGKSWIDRQTYTKEAAREHVRYVRGRIPFVSYEYNGYRTICGVRMEPIEQVAAEEPDEDPDDIAPEPVTY